MISVKPLFLLRVRPRSSVTSFATSPYHSKLANHWHTFADDLDIWQVLPAPKQVFRSYLLTEPKERLKTIEHELYDKYILHPDLENKQFRHYLRYLGYLDSAGAEVFILFGCRVEYIDSYFGRQLLEQLQLYLGFDKEIRAAYKDAVLELFREKSRFWEHSAPISREVFGAIGSLLSFTSEELKMKLDLKTHALLDNVSFTTCLSEGTGVIPEEDPNDGLYMDRKRGTFRYQNPVLDKRNRNPRYWSRATLSVWMNRLCYD